MPKATVVLRREGLDTEDWRQIVEFDSQVSTVASKFHCPGSLHADLIVGQSLTILALARRQPAVDQRQAVLQLSGQRSIASCGTSSDQLFNAPVSICDVAAQVDS